MKITDEPFEVGMLHPKIVHDLERPSTRIAGWGSTAVNKSERNAMKKIAAEEREAIRTAIRLDVDDELAEWVYSRALVDDARCNEHIILKALKEFNLPFPSSGLSSQTIQRSKLPSLLSHQRRARLSKGVWLGAWSKRSNAMTEKKASWVTDSVFSFTTPWQETAVTELISTVRASHRGGRIH